MEFNLRIGLEGYELLRIQEAKDLQLHVQLKDELEPKQCPYCGACRLHSKGRYVRTARHLSCLGHERVLKVSTRRFKCLDCQRSFLPDLPGILPYRHSSEPFRNSIFTAHQQGVCASTVASERGVGSATVERIYHQFTVRKASERTSLDCPAYLGIDEHTLHKGQRFCTTFCDLKNHRVFEVQPGRSESELEDFLCSLKGRDKVRVICIDLSSTYRRLVKKWFPNARIVADRFHVVRLIYHHCLQLARALVPELKNHRGALAALRKAPERLNDKQRQRRDQLLKDYPQLKPLYIQMHQLRKLMNRKSRTKAQCKKHINELLNRMQWCQRSALAPLQILAGTLTEWEDAIVCMWRFRKNNSITEGFHRKMKLIQRRAYGFKNFNNYRLRVIAQCG